MGRTTRRTQAASHTPVFTGAAKGTNKELFTELVTSVCPLPRYGNCIVTRPSPPGEVEGPCGDISNP
jgi:hypothetical protein